jgi:hypothetical protein
MRAFFRFGLLVMGLVGSPLVLGCAAPDAEEDGESSATAMAKGSFDRNDVLSDAALRDTKAMTAADVQKFLEATPFKTRSGLADYQESGKTAAQHIHEAAMRHGINPLALLVRVQMEWALVSKTNPSKDNLERAFGRTLECACGDTRACAEDSSSTFARQADRAAKGLRDSFEFAKSPAIATAKQACQFKRGVNRQTEDRLSVRPRNAASAAVYTYTPYVGKLGGGDSRAGGASLHAAIWERFASFINYAPLTETTERP